MALGFVHIAVCFGPWIISLRTWVGLSVEDARVHSVVHLCNNTARNWNLFAQ